LKNEFPGDVLLSHAVYREVPSGLKGLTAVFGMGTGVAPSLRSPGKLVYKRAVRSRSVLLNKRVAGRSFDSRLKYFMVKPHGRLVRVSFTPYSASTPRLSTWSSPTGLQGIAPGKSHLEEGFPLICFQRLSFRTSLPGRAAGATTGAQEVRPSRSSRTKDGSSQISCAHTR
jgi:hypothetical protein